MLQAIIENTETLNNFLREFRPAFKNQPQFKLFQHYVVAMILYLGSKNLSGLSNAIPDGRSESSLYRFVAEYDWDTEQVEACRLSILSRHTRRALQAAQRQGKTVPVFVIIDDSLVKKTGKTMEGVATHYSHTEHKQVLSHVWVTGQLVVMGHSYPLDWKLYRRQAECERAGVRSFPNRNWRKPLCVTLNHSPILKPMYWPIVGIRVSNCWTCANGVSSST